MEWAYSLDYAINDDGNTSGESRPYILRHISAGHFILDERNGILLDHYLDGNRLFSSFTVSGNVITTEEELDGDTLRMTVRTYKPGTGQGATGVSSMKLLSSQVCLLTR